MDSVDSPELTETKTMWQRLKERFSVHPAVLFIAVAGFNAMVGVAASQAGGGGGGATSQVCGTTLAQGATQTSQFITGILILACIVVAGLAEGYSRIKRDPQAQADIRAWRNGAAVGVVSVPLLMWAITIIAGFFNIPVVGCIDLVPYL